MTRYGYEIAHVDEEGYAHVDIFEEGSVEVFSSHVVRVDQARQWAEQEVYELERRTPDGYDSLTREADR